jgi:hypothetical protein
VTAFTDREAKIAVLLEWWADVVEGWQEAGSGADDFGIRMMARAYNHPSYRELERCLIALRAENKPVYRHVQARYRGERRMVLECPHCHDQLEIAAKHFDDRGHVRKKHKHGDVVFFVRKSVPVLPEWVREDVVRAGIADLAERFCGEPFIPNFGRKKDPFIPGVAA